jgi:hypothetical protein
MLLQCHFQNNEQEDMSVSELLRVHGPDSYRDRIFKFILIWGKCIKVFVKCFKI